MFVITSGMIFLCRLFYCFSSNWRCLIFSFIERSFDISEINSSLIIQYCDYPEIVYYCNFHGSYAFIRSVILSAYNAHNSGILSKWRLILIFDSLSDRFAASFQSACAAIKRQCRCNLTEKVEKIICQNPIKSALTHWNL